jgi:hypothetical protein
MYIRGYVQLELYTNNFGGTKLKTNYIWGYANKKGWIPLVQTIQSRTVGELINDELEEIQREAAVDHSWYYPSIYLEKPRKTTKTLSQNSRCPAEIRTEHLPNTSLECYL